jgi:hypothetical protein
MEAALIWRPRPYGRPHPEVRPLAYPDMESDGADYAVMRDRKIVGRIVQVSLAGNEQRWRGRSSATDFWTTRRARRSLVTSVWLRSAAGGMRSMAGDPVGAMRQAGQTFLPEK